MIGSATDSAVDCGHGCSAVGLIIRKIIDSISVACRKSIINCKLVSIPSPGISRHATFLSCSVICVACRMSGITEIASGAGRRSVAGFICKKVDPIPSVACRKLNVIICKYAPAPSGILRHATSSPLSDCCHFDTGVSRAD
jgi:hypothetical protein